MPGTNSIAITHAHVTPEGSTISPVEITATGAITTAPTIHTAV